GPLGRQVRFVGLSRSLAAAPVRRHPLVVGVDTHGRGRGADPDLAADESPRHRVLPLFEDHVAVAMHRRLLPGGRLVARLRQRQERRSLFGLEDIERPFAGGAVDALAGDLDDPALQLAIARVDRLAIAAGQEVVFDVLYARFDFALLLGRAWRRWVDTKAVVPRQLAVAAM